MTEMKIVGMLSRSPLFGRRQIVLLPMAWVEGWTNNPPVRTEERNLEELKHRLREEVGQLVPASVIPIGKIDGSPRYRLVDGHRRHVILKINGVEYLEAVLYVDVEGGSDLFGLLFEALNTATRAIGIRERVWLALSGEPKAAGDDAVKLAEEIKKSISFEALRAFMEHVCPIQAFRNAKTAFATLTYVKLEENDKANRRRFLSACLLWQFKHNEQQSLKLLNTEYNKLSGQELRGRGKRMLQSLNAAIAADQGLPADLRGKSEEDDEEDLQEAA